MPYAGPHLTGECYMYFFAVRHFVSGIARQFLIGNFHYLRCISTDIMRMSPRSPANTPTESIPKSREEGIGPGKVCHDARGIVAEPPRLC